MTSFEPLRGAPRILDIETGEFIDLDYLEEEPEATASNLSVQRSISGAVETQPERPLDRPRVMVPAISVQARSAIQRLWDQTLVRGGVVELLRDPTKCLHLAGDVETDSRRLLSPRAGSTYSLLPHMGQHGGGMIGVYADDESDTTNRVHNGDFVDGTIDSLPTNWTKTGLLFSFVRDAYYTLALDSFHARASSQSGGGTAYTDMELGAALSAIVPAAIAISLYARSDRRIGSTPPTDAMQITVGPADGSDAAVEVASFTPDSRWRRYTFVQPMTTTEFPTTTDETLRLTLVFDGDYIDRTSIYIGRVQVEIGTHPTGFVANSSVRSGVNGSRPANQTLKYLNPLGYAAQIPAHQAGERFGFTIATYYNIPWASADMPSSTAVLYSDGDNSFAGKTVRVWMDDDFYWNASVKCDDGTTETIMAAAASAPAGGTVVEHIAVTWLDVDAEDTEDSGKLAIYLDGVLSITQDHSKRAGGMQPFCYPAGPGPSGTAGRGSFAVEHFTLDAVYIDGADVTIADYYDADAHPTARERMAWRCVLDPGHSGGPFRTRDNLTDLDLQLFEWR
jgi:hypothetical protein